MPGHSRKWKTVKVFGTAIDKYIKLCKDEEEPITIVGFCHHGGISETSLYKNYKNSKEYGPTFTRLKTASKHDILSKALKGDYNPSIAKLVLSVNHDMREEQVVRENITVSFKGKKF